jgi:hypothetical protein
MTTLRPHVIRIFVLIPDKYRYTGITNFITHLGLASFCVLFLIASARNAIGKGVADEPAYRVRDHTTIGRVRDRRPVVVPKAQRRESFQLTLNLPDHTKVVRRDVSEQKFCFRYFLTLVGGRNRVDPFGIPLALYIDHLSEE